MCRQHGLALVSRPPFVVRTYHLRRVRSVKPYCGARTEHTRQINAVAEIDRTALNVHRHRLIRGADPPVPFRDNHLSLACNRVNVAVQRHRLGLHLIAKKPDFSDGAVLDRYRTGVFLILREEQFNTPADSTENYAQTVLHIDLRVILHLFHFQIVHIAVTGAAGGLSDKFA